MGVGCRGGGGNGGGGEEFVVGGCWGAGVSLKVGGDEKLGGGRWS